MVELRKEGSLGVCKSFSSDVCDGDKGLEGEQGSGRVVGRPRFGIPLTRVVQSSPEEESRS